MHSETDVMALESPRLAKQTYKSSTTLFLRERKRNQPALGRVGGGSSGSGDRQEAASLQSEQKRSVDECMKSVNTLNSLFDSVNA